MIQKKWLWFTGVLVVVALAIVLIDPSGQSGSRSSQVDQRLGQAVLGSDRAVDVDMIEVSHKIGSEEKRIQITRSGDGLWQIKEEPAFPVDPRKIVQLFDQLNRSKFSAVVGSSAASFAELGLDQPTQLLLKVKDQEVLKLRLGNRRPAGGQYVAMGDEEKAYQTSQDFQVTADHDAWESKLLLNLAGDTIQSLEFRPAKGLKKKPVVISRAKKEDVLKIQNLAKSDKESAAVKDAVSPFASLQFLKLYDPSHIDANAAMESPSFVSVKLFDGRTYQIAVGSSGDQDKKKYFIKVTAPEGDTLNKLMLAHRFELSAYLAQQLERGLVDFLEPKNKG